MGIGFCYPSDRERDAQSGPLTAPSAGLGRGRTNLMITWTEDQLAECRCNLCGASNDVHIFQRPDGLRVVQCEDCGLVYLNPRPKDELIPELYDKSFFTSRSSICIGNYFSDKTRIAKISDAKRSLLALKEAGIESFRKMLEVGCGTGEFCHVVHNRGTNVTGIDIAESVIAESRSRYEKIPFHVGTIKDLDPETKYDAVFAREVIEHLTDPDAFFGKTCALLEKNGFLCITTPSFECAERVGFDNWHGFFCSFEHLYFFSSAAISKYASKHGMYVVCTLYGGGNGQKGNQSMTREVIRRMLTWTYLLWPVRNLLWPVRKIRRMMRPMLSQNYQAEEIRHNLLMVLRKCQ